MTAVDEKRCERTWKVKMKLFDPSDRYRQHRCGRVGPHHVHVCRYCGREATPVRRKAV